MNIGERIEAIMEKEGYSKNSLAKSIGIHPSTLNNWIQGKTSPDSLKLDILCGFLNINTNWLMTGEGEVYITPSVTEIPNPTIAMIPLVSQYAYAGYLNGYGDMEYIETLPKYPVPLDHTPSLNLYIAFEVKGDSMENGTEESLVEGDILICREVLHDYWRCKLHINKWDFVIVHREDGVIVKRIIDHDVVKGLITIHSLNPFYKDRKVELKDVVKLFNVISVVRSRRR